MTSVRPALAPLQVRHRRWTWPSAALASALATGALGARHPLTALLILIVVAGSVVVIIQPFYGVLGLAIITPVSSATRRGLIVPHLRLSEALIIWLAPLVILVARRPVRSWGRLEWLGLAYALGTLLLGSFDLWRRGAPFSASNVATMLGPLQYLLLLRAVRVAVASERQVNLLARCMLLTAVPVCVLALLQGFGVTWARDLGHSLTGLNEGHPDRATALFTNWQVLAGYLLAVGSLAVGIAAYHATAIFTTRTAALLAILSGLALARTLTIGALVGWLVASGALLVMSGRVRLTARRVSALVAGTVAVVALVLTARYQQEFVARPGQASNGIVPNTVIDRIHNWTQQYLPALSGRWVTGYGPDIPADATWKYTDSVYVTLILRGGMILMSIYVWLMIGFASAADRVRREARASRESSALATVLLVLVVILIPLQVLATYFTTSGLPELMWILAALVSVDSFARLNADAA